MTRHTDIVIDADAHILEPPDLWQRYIDPAFRDRPICIKTDERGLEYLEIDGKMSRRNSGGMLFTVGGYGKSPQELMPRPDRTYAGTAPLGAMHPGERLTYMDQEGVDASVLYPSLALLWEPEVFDAALCDTYCRAYNRWIVDFCADSADRLIPIAHISLGDVERAVPELAAHLLHPLLGRERPGVEERRLARHLADEKEHDERHEQKLHGEQQQASCDVPGEPHAIGERVRPKAARNPLHPHGRQVPERSTSYPRPQPRPRPNPTRGPSTPRWRSGRGGAGTPREQPSTPVPGPRRASARRGPFGTLRPDRPQLTCRAGRSGCCCRGTTRTPSTPPSAPRASRG